MNEKYLAVAGEFEFDRGAYDALGELYDLRVDGETITIMQGISTMMACENPAEMAQEAAYLQMLPQAGTWSITGDTLELRTADGALIASYVAG